MRVSDNGNPSLSITTNLTVIVNEVNLPPELATIPDQAVRVGDAVKIQTTATDPDIPANALTFSLAAGAPAGAGIDANTGVFTWTPNTTQTTGTNRLTVRVTDNGLPPLSDEKSFSIVVRANAPPTVTISNPTNGATFTATGAITIRAEASDPDGSIANVEFFQGIVKLGETRNSPYQISWPNVLAGSYLLTAKATDNQGAAATSAPVSIMVVSPTNHPPTISPIDPQRIDEGVRLAFLVQASDLDVPAQILTYSLAADAPLGASIQPTTGLFTWTPTEAQGPSTNVIAIRVTDNGAANLNATTNFTVIVNEVNLPPVLAPIADQTIGVGDTVTFRASATDPDIPANGLAFSLGPGAPTGAKIAADTGVFAWTPSAAQASSTNRFTVRVTDNGSPPLSDSKAFTVFVQPKPGPTNMPPTVRILSPADRTIFQDGEPISIEAAASDPDLGGRVDRVQFFAGSSKLGEVSTQPYIFLWVGANEGQSVLTARAVDGQGATGDSAPVRIVVSKACTQAAIVGSLDDSEITALVEYLYEIGVKALVFDRSEATREETIAAQLKKFESFGLVIWDDAGRTGLSDREVNLFGALANPVLGKALYYIGDTLVSSAKQLNTPQRTQWFDLIHLTAKSGLGVPTRAVIDTAANHPVVTEGKAGTVRDFNYPFLDQGTEQTRNPNEQVLGRAGSSDVLVAFEESTAGVSGRRITQAFRVANGGEDASKAERKKLFQNAVWWLMKCACDNLNVTIVDNGSPTAAKVGEQLTYSVKVSQAGGCEALLVTASSVLPLGLEFLGASSEVGVLAHNNGVVTFALGRLTRGAEATLQIRARYVQGGVFTNAWQLRSLNESDGARLDNHVEVVTQVEGSVESPLTLSVKAGAEGLLEITLRSPRDQTIVVETSADLQKWTPIQTVVLTGGQAVFLDVTSTTSHQRFYRATTKR